MSRRGGRCLPFDRVWPSPIFSLAALQTYAGRRHTAQSWYQSALWLRRHPALARSTLRDSILTKRVVAARRHQPPDGGSVDTGQPASRQRPASSLPSRHARARTARAAIRATPTSGASASGADPAKSEIPENPVFVEKIEGPNRSQRVTKRLAEPETAGRDRVASYLPFGLAGTLPAGEARNRNREAHAHLPFDDAAVATSSAGVQTQLGDPFKGGCTPVRR